LLVRAASLSCRRVAEIGEQVIRLLLPAILGFSLMAMYLSGFWLWTGHWPW
jgi:hypothetical protein